ncbi:MAG: hypothetical protein H5T85_08555, partial [Actinobacteria bacterium]|nr:hypothetical protein [Actinomycetota bacterium]
LKSPLDDKELERLLTLALRNKVARRKHRKAFWWKNLRATNNSIQPAKKNFESDLSYDNSSGNNNGKTNKMTRNNEIKINNYLPDSDLPSQRSEVPDSFKTTDEKIEPENRYMTYDASINSTNIDTEVRKGREDETRVTGKGYQELNYQELKTGNVRTIKQKAIVFVKAKGGVGSTLLCIFLGLTFSKLKTLIVDLNFSEGGSDIGYYLNIPKSPSIVNFMESYTRGAMEASVFSIRNNLDVLQAPPTYELSRKIELPDIYSLVDLARRKYHIIVFDLSCQINELWLGVVDLADILVMVSDNTLGSLGRLISINKKFICQDLEKMLVINKYVSGKANKLEIEESQLKELLDLRDLVYLEEVDFLKGRSDFSNLDLLAIRSFDSFARKVLDILTYD